MNGNDEKSSGKPSTRSPRIDADPYLTGNGLIRPLPEDRDSPEPEDDQVMGTQALYDDDDRGGAPVVTSR